MKTIVSKRMSKFGFALLTMLLSSALFQVKASVDPNFHIYICFGQSNMEGNAAIGAADQTGVSSRFRVLTVAADDYSHLGRSVGNWYTAVPPLCRWDTGLTPADYFGRTLTDSLPDSVKVGVIVVAMGGSGIDAFDKDNYVEYYTNADAWQKGLMNIYGGNPYAKIIEMAKLAQQSGVIKGILLHQGESNNMQPDWPLKVQKIYNNILADLKMEPNSIPLLAGEMLRQDQGGICWGMNDIIAKLPYYVPNSYPISSQGCTGNGKDGFHFSTVGARELGKRYGLQMLSLMKSYHTVEGQTVDHLEIGNTKFTMLTGTIKRVPLNAVYSDGHKQDINFRATYSLDNAEAVKITNGFIQTMKDGVATVTASYKGALGEMKQTTFSVTATTFPLTNELFNPNIFSTGSFDETTRTLKTGQWGFGGWQYEGINLSEYKYIVAQLGSSNNSDVTFNIFDENNYWGSSASYKFADNSKIIVNLATAKKTGGTPFDPSHVYIAGFWSNGSNPFIIDKVYLAKTDAELTSIREVLDKDEYSNEKVDVYSITGILTRTQVERKTATDQLPNGVYVLKSGRKTDKVLHTQQSVNR
ncbi:MAG: hypothetical protein BGN96_02495 [Bacteroidales bacterium 45-6]|nr:MAG: hypothetical protein BGN96_02495 [Bacteroidales bacterium 45-6]